MNNIWKHEIVSSQDTYGRDLTFLKFMGEQDPTVEIMAVNRVYSLRTNILNIADCIAAHLRQTRERAKRVFISSPYGAVLTVQAPAILAYINVKGNSSDYEAPGSPATTNEAQSPKRDIFDATRTITVDIAVAGSRDEIKEIFDVIDSSFKEVRQAQIKWWYETDRKQIMYRNIYLTKPGTVLRPEFYPGLDVDPDVFIKEYMESDASILLLAGEPGTGKTTMLRHLICENELTAHVVYDESLMEKDEIFQNFLFENESDVMIIEDADSILSSRDMDHNKLMARFLNVADGLVKLPNKKMIFTTNISDFGRVDAALLRPGRCFAVCHTRPLKFSEAQKAAEAANIPAPTENREYTLAELFNAHQRAEVRRAGF